MSWGGVRELYDEWKCPNAKTIFVSLFIITQGVHIFLHIFEFQNILKALHG